MKFSYRKSIFIFLSNKNDGKHDWVDFVTIIKSASLDKYRVLSFTLYASEMHQPYNKRAARVLEQSGSDINL
jgi:hypothetical protein